MSKKERQQMHHADFRNTMSRISGAYLDRVMLTRDFNHGVRGIEALGAVFCSFITTLAKCLVVEKRLEFCLHFIKALEHACRVELGDFVEQPKENVI